MLAQQKTNPEKEEKRGLCFVYDFWGSGNPGPKNHKQNSPLFPLPFLDLFSAVTTQIFLQNLNFCFFGAKNMAPISQNGGGVVPFGATLHLKRPRGHYCLQRGKINLT